MRQSAKRGIPAILAHGAPWIIGPPANVVVEDRQSFGREGFAIKYRQPATIYASPRAENAFVTRRREGFGNQSQTAGRVR